MVETKQELEQLVDNLIKLHYFEIQDFSISPNDEEIMIVFGNTDMPHDEYAYEERNRSIWKLTIADGSVVQLTSPEEDAHAVCWSPNGERIAYLSRASGKKEVWQMHRDGTNKLQLTSTDFSGKDPFTDTKLMWSPNGKFIAYTAEPNGSFYGLWQLLMKEREESSDIQIESGVNRNDLCRQQARSRFESSLSIVDVETRKNKCIMTSDQSCSLIDWHDDKTLLISYSSNLTKIDIETGNREQLYSGEFDLIKRMDTNFLSAQITETCIVIGYISEHGFIKKCEVKHNGRDFLTLHTWSLDGKKLYFTDQIGMSNLLYVIDVHTGEVQALTERGATVEHVPTCPAKVQNFHHKDAVLFPFSSPSQFTALWEVSGMGKTKQISELFNEYIPKDLPSTKLIHYRSNGHEIESLLILPKDYDETKSYPTLIFLHGGPEDYVSANFAELISGRGESAAHLLASCGYVVLMPNFRGSLGYGADFINELAHYQLMKAPYEDLIAGVNYLVDAGIADANKLGVYGTSFGAILTAWAISQTSLFKGAIGSVGIYDMLQTDRYVNEAFHSIFENRSKGTIKNDLWVKPDVYKELSPMEHFDKINTPLLFIETGAEREKNGSQAMPLFNALHTRGIKTNLIYYPEAFHTGGWNDAYKRDYMKRLVAWFDYSIKGIDLPDWFEKG